MKPRFDLIGFDGNGTLFDDTAQFIEIVNKMLFHYGHRLPLPAEKIRAEFGQPWTKIFRDAGIDEGWASDEELYKCYNDLYRKELRHIELTPGAARTLKIFREKKGIKLAFVSAQMRMMNKAVLQRHGALNYFEDRVVSKVSDKAATLRALRKKLNISAERAAYVGDQVGDVAAARAAGWVSIAYACGLHTEDMLFAAHPTYIVRSFDRDLLNLACPRHDLGRMDD